MKFLYKVLLQKYIFVSLLQFVILQNKIFKNKGSINFFEINLKKDFVNIFYTQIIIPLKRTKCSGQGWKSRYDITNFFTS